MTEIHGHTQIYFDGKHISYELSALIVARDDTHAMCSLMLCKDYGSDKQEELEFWDNEYYLIETLFEKVIVPWVKDKTIIDNEAFSEVLKTEGVSLDDFQGLYDLFVTGISKGLFYEYFKDRDEDKF